MSSRNETLFDGSEEKKLSEIDQLVVHATHVQIHQRHMAINFIVNNLSVLCKHDIKKLFVVIDTLQKDQVVSVRTLLAEKLFEIGSYFSGHSKLGRYITSDLYDVIYKSLTDCNSQVRRACCDSVFSLLNVNSIPHSLVDKTLLSVVLESTAAENDDEHRADGIFFLMGLSPYMSYAVVMTTVLPLYLQLASDSSFHVRRASAACYGDMCKLVGTEATESLLLEKFSNLCEDNVWAVRKACVTSFPGVATILSSETRSSHMTDLYLKLLSDQSRWVRLMSYQVLGEFIATFRFDKPQEMHGSHDDANLANKFIGESKISSITDNKNMCEEEVGGRPSGRINLSFRSDSEGDDVDKNIAEVSDDCKDTKIISEENQKLSDDLISNCRMDGNIFVSDFNEFVSKMFGDEQDTSETFVSVEGPSGNDESVVSNHFGNANVANSKVTVDDHFDGSDNLMDVGKEVCKTTIERSDIGCKCREEMDVIDTVGNNFSNQINKDNTIVEYQSTAHNGASAVNLTTIGNKMISNYSENKTDSSVVSSKDDVCATVAIGHVCKSETFTRTSPTTTSFNDGLGKVTSTSTSTTACVANNKRLLLRSAPVLLILDAGSVEELDAPVFETALNFGTTHHHIRSKPTTVCFGEEVDGEKESKCENDDFDDIEDELITADSRLESADDFSHKSCLNLPEETVAARPLSPVTCRTLKAGGGRWCRQTMVYVTSKEGYGKMPNVGSSKMKKSCDFVQCPVPGKLLDTYLEMSDTYLSELFDSDIQLHCAHSFPAVTLSSRKINWPVLKEFYMIMAASSQVRVRRTLSYSIHEMAAILGDDIIMSDLLGVFDDFCCDVDEVKMGVVEHLHDFFKLLPLEEKLKHLNMLPGMMADENGRNWRMRDVMIRELEKILDLLTLEQTRNHLLSFVFSLVSDQVAVVRQSAIKLIGKIIYNISESVETESIKPDDERSPLTEEKLHDLSSPNFREDQIVEQDVESVTESQTSSSESTSRSEDAGRKQSYRENSSAHGSDEVSNCSDTQTTTNSSHLSSEEQPTTTGKEVSSMSSSVFLHYILDELIHKFANSSNFRQRQSFILVCHHLLNIPHLTNLDRIFSPNFLLGSLLLLHSDAIVNVRITLCRILYADFPKMASLDHIKKSPTELLDPINRLWNDSDPDVHKLAEKFLSLIVH